MCLVHLISSLSVRGQFSLLSCNKVKTLLSKQIILLKKIGWWENCLSFTKIAVHATKKIVEKVICLWHLPLDTSTCIEVFAGSADQLMFWNKTFERAETERSQERERSWRERSFPDMEVAGLKSNSKLKSGPDIDLPLPPTLSSSPMENCINKNGDW